MIRSERRIRFVYFARRADGSGPVKIGNATRPDRRLRELNLICETRLEFLAVAPGGFTDEQATHQKFAAHRLNGEWFAPSDELFEFIAKINKTGVLPLSHGERRADVFTARYLAGESYQAIADDHGISRERVRQVLRSHGVPSRGHKRPHSNCALSTLGAPGAGKPLPAPKLSAEP